MLLFFKSIMTVHMIKDILPNSIQFCLCVPFSFLFFHKYEQDELILVGIFNNKEI